MHSTTSSNKTTKILQKVVIPLLFWVGVWQLFAIWVGTNLLLPSPLSVLDALSTLVVTQSFWQTMGASLLRVFGGFLLGAILGTLCAVVGTIHPMCHLILSPAVKIIRATPLASFLVLVLLWTPTNQVPAIVAAMMVLPVLWGNVTEGIAQTSPLLKEAAEMYGFSPWKKLRLLYIPSVFPYFISGCNTALGLAWKAGVAAEVLCLPTLAIGTMLYRAKITLQTPSVFGWTAVVIVLSILLERLFVWSTKQLLRGLHYD